MGPPHHQRLLAVCAAFRQLEVAYPLFALRRLRQRRKGHSVHAWPHTFQQRRYNQTGTLPANHHPCLLDAIPTKAATLTLIGPCPANRRGLHRSEGCDPQSLRGMRVVGLRPKVRAEQADQLPWTSGARRDFQNCSLIRMCELQITGSELLVEARQQPQTLRKPNFVSVVCGTRREGVGRNGPATKPIERARGEAFAYSWNKNFGCAGLRHQLCHKFDQQVGR